jgi:hypothetical protein
MRGRMVVFGMTRGRIAAGVATSDVGYHGHRWFEPTIFDTCYWASDVWHVFTEVHYIDNKLAFWAGEAKRRIF